MINTLKISLMNIPIFIIHYKKLTERKIFLDKWFSDHNISVNWIFEGQREDITDDILNKYYNYKESQNFGKQLSLGEIGCVLGHLSAMQKIIDNNYPYGLIFEDDVYLDEFFAKEFDSIFYNCPSDFDVISLGSCSGIKHPNAEHEKYENRFFRIDPPRGRCGYAQVISNKACKIAIEESIPFSWPADWQIYNIASNNTTNPFVTYWIEPPIAFEGSTNSRYQSSIR